VHDLLFDYAIVPGDRSVFGGGSLPALVCHLLILSPDSHHFLLAGTDRWPASSAWPDVIGRVPLSKAIEVNTIFLHLSFFCQRSG
jgi:hypothetical protein